MSDKPLTDVTLSSFDLHPALMAGLEEAGFSRCAAATSPARPRPAPAKPWPSS
jgi:ATP-dependent RNA helicase RhlB